MKYDHEILLLQGGGAEPIKPAYMRASSKRA